MTGPYKAGASRAGAGTPVSEASLTCLGYEQITDLSSAVGLTVPLGARLAVIVAEDQAVRWRDDGADPTASVGMPLAVGVQFTYPGNLSAFRVIEQDAGAKINVSYYK